MHLPFSVCTSQLLVGPPGAVAKGRPRKSGHFALFFRGLLPLPARVSVNSTYICSLRAGSYRRQRL